MGHPACKMFISVKIPEYFVAKSNIVIFGWIPVHRTRCCVKFSIPEPDKKQQKK